MTLAWRAALIGQSMEMIEATGLGGVEMIRLFLICKARRVYRMKAGGGLDSEALEASRIAGVKISFE